MTISNTEENEEGSTTENIQKHQLTEMNLHFKLPVQYTDSKELHIDTINDLELVETMDTECKPIYEYTFKPRSTSGSIIMKQISRYYSSNVDFLKDTQKIIKQMTKGSETIETDVNSSNLEETQNIWMEIKNDTGFKEKYHYIDWNYWEHLNHSEGFLELMSIYNLASPVISLCIPILLLIIPFFVIRVKGLQVSVKEYLDVLKTIAANHSIGKLFTDFNSVDLQGKTYLLVSAAFYVFSIYQNALVCYRFHQNMYKIHEYLNKILLHIQSSIEKINHFLCYSSECNTYTQFNIILKHKLEKLHEMRKQLERITPYELTIFKVKDLGTVLKCFYDIYSSEDYNETLLYSFGFCGYLELIEGLQENIQEKKISFAKLSKKSKSKMKMKSSFKQAYHPSLMNEKPVKNNCNFKNNMIITGPNASGKTTILKTTLINTILTQQFGCGFYSEATMYPFNHIHCYLNIPDTSGRDSLFQSETRKCNDIINSIKENSVKETHFCVFDELYSGTNPEEAAKCGYAFLLYLSQQKNVSFALTTHYLDICKNIQNNADINNTGNYQMVVDKKDDEPMKYKYTIKKGITQVNGGIEVLKQMNYPTEIMDTLNIL